MPSRAVKNRLIEAIYVFFAAISAITIALSIPIFIDAYKDVTNSTMYFDRDPSSQALLCIGISAAFYVAGWGIRWIATGKKKFKIDLSN